MCSASPRSSSCLADEPDDRASQPRRTASIGWRHADSTFSCCIESPFSSCFGAPSIKRSRICIKSARAYVRASQSAAFGRKPSLNQFNMRAQKERLVQWLQSRSLQDFPPSRIALEGFTALRTWKRFTVSLFGNSAGRIAWRLASPSPIFSQPTSSHGRIQCQLRGLPQPECQRRRKALCSSF